MSAQIDTYPNLIRPNNQPLIFTISDTSTTPDRFVVWVEEDGVEISKLYLTPNTNDVVHFDLSEVVRGRVSCDDKTRDESQVLHNYSSLPFTTGRNGLKKYEVKVGTFTGTTESGVQDQNSAYLLDGAEQISDGLHPDFSDYYATSSTKKTWLSDRSPTSDVIEVYASEDDEGCLVFLNDNNIISALTQVVELKVFNGLTILSTTTKNISAANGAQSLTDGDINKKLTYLMAMPKNTEGWLSPSDKLSANPTWSHYEVVVQNGSLSDMSNVMRVHKDCRPTKHQAVQMTWTNTRGGWDYLRFDGRSPKTTTASSKMYKKSVGDYDSTTFTFLPSARDSQPYHMTAKQTYQLKSVDFSQAEIELLQYALRSDNVMIRVGEGEWLPVNIDTKSYKVEESISKVTSISFNVTQAQDIKC